MAFTFLAALGHDVGASMVDEDRIEAVSYTHLDVYKRQDIDHGVALQHAKPEIVEVDQLHPVFLTFCAELKPKSVARRGWSARQPYPAMSL